MTGPVSLLASVLFVAISQGNDNSLAPHLSPGQRDALTRIVASGGRVQRDWEVHGQPVIGLTLPTGWDDFDSLLLFPTVRQLALFGPTVTDAQLEKLTALRQVNDLLIRHAAVTDDGLAHLRSFPDLVHVHIGQTEISDRGLEHLAGIPSLRHVALHETDVTADGVDRLKQSLSRAYIWDDCSRWNKVLPRRPYWYVAGGALVGVAVALGTPRLRRNWWVVRSVLPAVLIGWMGVALMSFAERFRPAKVVAAAEFWQAVSGVRFDNPKFWRWGTFIEVRDGHYIAYIQGMHGSELFCAPKANVEALFPEVVRRLEASADQGSRSEDLCIWLATRPATATPDDLLSSLAIARADRLRPEIRDFDDYEQQSHRYFVDQWDRSKRYSWNIALEFAFLSLVIGFAFWPFVFGLSRRRWAIHLGLLPTLICLPYWLGYAPLAMTSAAPGGGIFYPFVLLSMRDLASLSWPSIDLPILRAMPQPLEPLSQLPGGIMALSGAGLLGPTGMLTAGLLMAVPIWMWPWAKRHWPVCRDYFRGAIKPTKQPNAP